MEWGLLQRRDAASQGLIISSGNALNRIWSQDEICRSPNGLTL
jgi:hypothetical protein